MNQWVESSNEVSAEIRELVHEYMVQQESKVVGNRTLCFFLCGLCRM